MADVAKMPASVPTGPTGALAGDDGVDRPGDEIRDAGAEGKTSRSVATAGRTETAATAAGDGEGAREGGANANEDDADARATNGARGGGAIAEGAPSANAPPPASGDADRPDSEERDDEDDENDEDADDPSLATSDHDDETPLIPPAGSPGWRRWRPGAPPIDALGGEHHAGGAERVFPPPLGGGVPAPRHRADRPEAPVPQVRDQALAVPQDEEPGPAHHERAGGHLPRRPEPHAREVRGGARGAEAAHAGVPRARPGRRHQAAAAGVLQGEPQGAARGAPDGHGRRRRAARAQRRRRGRAGGVGGGAALAPAQRRREDHRRGARSRQGAGGASAGRRVHHPRAPARRRRLEREHGRRGRGGGGGDERAERHGGVSRHRLGADARVGDARRGRPHEFAARQEHAQ